MKQFLVILIVALTLQSCKFSCSVGEKDEDTGTVKVDNGTKLYNNIQLTANAVHLEKAFLTKDDLRVNDDNIVAFNGAVKMQLVIDSGWTQQDGKVLLGASEKIVDEMGNVIVDEADLFSKYPEGVSPDDAKYISLSATVTLKENAPPTSVTVQFRIWDKKGNGSIEGSYKLHSK